jgi:lysophospholipase L1-like esterase
MIGRRTFNRLLALTPFVLGACGRRDEQAKPPPATSSEPPASPETASPPTSARASGIGFLALGDSYTIGESVAVNERWPVQLTARLREAGLDVADPEIIAQTGWRTDALDAAITRAKPQGPYPLVTLLIGVNDQYQGRPAEEYRQSFPALLQRAIGLAGGDPSHVIVLSIPDWGVTPFGRQSGDPAGIAVAIDAYNAINRAESQKAGVRYVDVTPVSRLAPQQPDLIANDGLHPSGKMYAEWVKLALPAAREAVGAVKE